MITGAMRERPVRSAVPSEPIFNVPSVIVALIGLLVLVQIYRSFVVGDDTVAVIRFLADAAFVPLRFGLATGLLPETAAARMTEGLSADELELARALGFFFLRGGEPHYWTLLTYAFAHGDWTHLAINCAWLLAFGSVVARRFGAGRFVLFFLLTAGASAVFHFALNPTSIYPLVGASGAISGAMAAAIRFMFVPPGRPAPPLLTALSDRRVLSFLGIWLGLNLLVGLGLNVGPSPEATVAWEAHVGGLLAGLIVFPLFDPSPGARES